MKLLRCQAKVMTWFFGLWPLSAVTRKIILNNLISDHPVVSNLNSSIWPLLTRRFRNAVDNPLVPILVFARENSFGKS